MSDDARRKILEAVAAGRMDPGDAANALADLDAPASPDEPDPPSDELAERVVERRVLVHGGNDTQLRVVRVDATFRAVEIVGDPGVHEAVAEGPHRVRWEGDALVIDGATGLDDDDFDDDEDDDRVEFGEWFRTRGPRMHKVRFSSGGRGDYRPRPLRVRMNPDIGLEARVEAGPLKILRVHAPIKARVTAGPLVIEDFASPIDVRVAAGKVDATGRLDRGESTIDCDAGKVRLHLTHGSHARVTASATLGKVGFGAPRRGARRPSFDDLGPNGPLGPRGFSGMKADFSDLSNLSERLTTMLNDAFFDDHEVVVGDGTATVDIRVSMGSADITFDDTPRP